MKVTNQRKFKPITLEITIESETELNALAHQLSVSGRVVIKNTTLDSIPVPSYDDIDDGVDELFYTIGNIALDYHS